MVEKKCKNLKFKPELWAMTLKKSVGATQVQACRQKIITSHLGCLQRLNIQRELGWGSAKGCVETSTHPKRAETKICKELGEVAWVPVRKSLVSYTTRKWVEVKNVWTSNENWDEDQEDSHHHLADSREMCTWPLKFDLYSLNSH